MACHPGRRSVQVQSACRVCSYGRSRCWGYLYVHWFRLQWSIVLTSLHSVARAVLCHQHGGIVDGALGPRHPRLLDDRVHLVPVTAPTQAALGAQALLGCPGRSVSGDHHHRPRVRVGSPTGGVSQKCLLCDSQLPSLPGLPRLDSMLCRLS